MSLENTAEAVLDAVAEPVEAVASAVITPIAHAVDAVASAAGNFIGESVSSPSFIERHTGTIILVAGAVLIIYLISKNKKAGDVVVPTRSQHENADIGPMSGHSFHDGLIKVGSSPSLN